MDLPVPRAFKCYTYVGDQELRHPAPTAVIVCSRLRQMGEGYWYPSYSCSLEEHCHAYICFYARKKIEREAQES